MNDHRSLEHEIRASFDERAPMSPPNHLLHTFEFNAQRTRRYPRWLALIKEPTMRTDSHLAVGSPTARLAAIVLATMLLAAGIVGASFAGAQLLAADGPIVVDASGDGHYETIQEAVAAAEDGDEILIKPGTYQGGIDVSKDIAIHGEDRDSVVVEAGIGCSVPDNPFSTIDCPGDPRRYADTWLSARPYAFLLTETEAELSDLTMELGVAHGVIARGGAPIVHDVTVAASPTDGFASIYVHDGSAATISDSDLGAAVVFFEERSPATIERSSVDFVIANTNNTALTGGPATIRDNTMFGIRFNGDAVVEGNTILAPAGETSGEVIEVQSGEGWFIRDNHIEGFASGTAIAAGRVGNGVISGNTLVDNQLAMSLGARSHEVSGNTIRGGQTGVLTRDGSAQIVDNDIEGVAGRAIAIGDGSPRLSGNRSCGNGENLWVADTATPEIDDTNEICEDAASE